MVGEAWTQIIGGGSFFGDVNNPQPVIKAGEEWSEGVLEMTDFVLTTRGPGKFICTLHELFSDLP